MVWTFNHRPGGHDVTFDFSPIIRPPAGGSSPEPTAPGEEIDAAEPVGLKPSRPCAEVRATATLLREDSREAINAPFLEPAAPVPRENEYAASRDAHLASLGTAVSSGGAGSDDPPSVMPASAPKRIVACTMSGNLCAIATLDPGGRSWRVSRTHSRLFQLTDTSQSGLRDFARELFQFLGPLRGSAMVSCPTKTGSVLGGLEDEARIETLLMMLPGLEIEKVDNEAIASWVVSANPPYPDNMPNGRNTFAQIRAIEAAQYIIERMV